MPSFPNPVAGKFPGNFPAKLFFALTAVLAVSQALADENQPDAEAPVEPEKIPENILVTAALEPIEQRLVAGSVTVITRAEIEQRQVKYLGELLRDVPGFAVSQAGGAGAQTQIRVRGAEANHLLVLVDGIRANDPASVDEFQLQFALASDIERIEIIRGPLSATWGTDALAGVINIIRRKDKPVNRLSGHAELGSFGTADLAMDGAWSRTGLRLQGGVAHHDTDGTNISRTGSEEDGATNTTLDAGLDLDLGPAWLLSFTGQHVDAESDFDEIDFYVTGLPVDADRVTQAERNYLRGLLRWQPADSLWSGETSLNWSRSDNDNLADGEWVDSTAADELEARLRTSLVLPGGEMAEAHRLTLGLDHRTTDFSQRGEALPWGDPNQDQSDDVSGVAFEYLGQPAAGLSWTASTRYDDFSDFDSATNWQLGLSHQVEPQLRFRASVGTGTKAPTFTERYGFYPDLFIGNPDLQPEESQGWELGLESQWLEGRLGLDVAYFDQDLENEIDGFVFDPATFLYTAVNKDTASDREGFELSGNYTLSERLDLGASYTYTDATEDDADGSAQAEIRRPRHIASLNANWGFGAGRGNLNLNLNYTGSQYDLFFDPATFIGETVELSSFTVADLAGSWRLGDKLDFVARVNNLTDTDYEEILGFARPGRAYYAGLRGRLDF